MAANKGRPDRSIKRNAAPSCRGPALRSVARQRAGASLHVSLWALICLRSRSLSADSHSFTGSCLSFLLSFFQFFLLPPPALRRRRHSNVPRRLFSGQHQCHVAALSRQHSSRRGRGFTWFGLTVIKNNNAGSISSIQQQRRQQRSGHPASTLGARACGRSSTKKAKHTKADRSCDSLRPFLPACKKSRRRHVWAPARGSMCRFTQKHDSSPAFLPLKASPSCLEIEVRAYEFYNDHKLHDALSYWISALTFDGTVTLV